MDPQVWLVGIIVLLEAYWPVVTVVAILILGPLVGFVIVAIVGAIRTAVAPSRQEPDSLDASELFSRFEDDGDRVDDAHLVHGRNDSI